MEGIDIEGRGKEEEGAGSDIHRMMEWIVEGIDIEGRGKEEIHRMMEWIMEGIDIEGREGRKRYIEWWSESWKGLI